MMCHRIGTPPTSTIGFGRVSVSSASREPSPPAKIATFIRLLRRAPPGRYAGSIRHAGRIDNPGRYTASRLQKLNNGSVTDVAIASRAAKKFYRPQARDFPMVARRLDFVVRAHPSVGMWVATVTTGSLGIDRT